MTREELNQLASQLREMEEFLLDCDENLAWEISAKLDIDTRVYRLGRQLPQIRRAVEKTAQKNNKN